MNPRSEANKLAHRWNDLDDLANVLGKAPETLRKELAGNPGFKLGVADLEQIVISSIARKIDNPLAPVTALAANVGCLLVKLPDCAPLDHGLLPREIARRMAAAAVSFGAWMHTTVESVEDDDVSANELKKAEENFSQLMAQGQACLAAMRDSHESAKPGHAHGVKA